VEGLEEPLVPLDSVFTGVVKKNSQCLPEGRLDIDENGES